MKKVFLGFFGTMMILFCAAVAFAEVPNEINYQGRLREYGQPVTANRTMNFKIYAIEAGGVPVWSSGDVVVAVTTGTFGYAMQPSGVDWRWKDFWVETTVSGKILSPREKIASGVYALHSRTAEGITKTSGTVTVTIGSIAELAVTTFTVSAEFNRLVNVSTPTAYDDGATKGYVDGLIGGGEGAVNLSASTQTKTGGLNVGGTIAAPRMQAAMNVSVGNAVFLSSGSSSFSGAVNVSTPAAFDNAASKGYVDTRLPTGFISIWGGTQASIPYGWLLCDGSAISRTTYARLFAAIGTVHGAGDGVTTFNLPPLRDRFIVGAGQSYAVGNTGGANDVTLAIAQTPPHNHGGATTGGANLTHAHPYSDYASYTQEPWGGSTQWRWTSDPTSQARTTSNSGTLSHDHSITAQGGGGSHENRPPYYALCYIIKN